MNKVPRQAGLAHGQKGCPKVIKPLAAVFGLWGEGVVELFHVRPPLILRTRLRVAHDAPGWDAMNSRTATSSAMIE